MPARLEGLAQAQAALNDRIRAIGAAGRRELMEFALAVMGKAAQNAPVETGDLRGSFVVEVNGERWMHTESGPSGAVNVIQDRQTIPGEADQIRVYVGTSGIVYAARQHEELTWRHPRGGYAKFLEKALDELSPQFLTNLQAAVKRAARGEDG